MRAGLVVGALGVLIGLERLLEVGVVSFGIRPLGQVWAWITGRFSDMPQAEIWAVLVGLFGLLGLRTLGGRATRPSPELRSQSQSQGSLQGWLELLEDRTRGEYFRWRLARRVASLADELELPAPTNEPGIEAFLQAGRQFRTIRAQSTRDELKLDPAILVEYLERTQDVKGSA
jgi:hypothetical protein